MQIVNEIQLDFSDVLIKPRRSYIASRKDADITREYKFKWCPRVIKGTGIMQANMGTIGNFDVSRKMLENGLFACLHKHHNIEDLIPFYKELIDNNTWERCLLSIGLKDNGVEKLREINKELGIQVGIKLDVPNGYIPQVIDMVEKLRLEFPNMFIMVGNIVTGEITEDFILSGADCVCVGIGSGAQCILNKTLVNTKNGYVEIQNIKEGDEVLTHTGEYHKVINKICYNHHKEKLNINGIECTPEHKFLVINKCDKDKVNEDNLMKYAYWEEAYSLDISNQLIVKRTLIKLEFIEIKKGEIEYNNDTVFDIEVEKDHSFVVGDGIVVHNCLTRRQTGCGRPQLSAIIECADAAHQVGGMICSDGGITCPGDIGKAFGAGADFIMIGSMFAGTYEADGDIIEKSYLTNEKTTIDMGYYNVHENIYEVKKFKQFYGMSSTLAQEKFGNGKPSYRASEGRVTLVPYSGLIQDIIEEFLGGLRSTMTYIGAKRLKDIPKQCVFYQVHNQLNTIYENNTIGK